MSVKTTVVERAWYSAVDYEGDWLSCREGRTVSMVTLGGLLPDEAAEGIEGTFRITVEFTPATPPARPAGEGE